MDPSQIKAKTIEWNQELKMQGYVLCDCKVGFLDLKGKQYSHYVTSDFKLKEAAMLNSLQLFRNY